jgi:hypothetical protein
VATTLGVLAASALIPVAVFAAPVERVPATAHEAGDPIPWELQGAIWAECPMQIELPVGYGAGWYSDALGDWHVQLFDEHSTEVPADEIAARFPEIVTPFQEFFDCLDRFPVLPYADAPVLNWTQRELYWSYLLTELAPCLRAHGRTVDVPTRRVFEKVDVKDWYLENAGAWDGQTSLDDVLTIWHECPVYPSYLEPAPNGDVTVVFRQAG